MNKSILAKGGATIVTQVEKRELIGLVQKDETSLTELYNVYFPRINNYVHYRVADYHDAEDLVSQILEKVFTKSHSYQENKAPFSVWLFRIARNTITDYYRSRKGVHNISLDGYTRDIVAREPEPAEIVELNELQHHLLKAIASLSQREQEIIALKFWSDLSNREIARLVGISESNTGVILFRAMRQLRLILASQGMCIYE
ncbi:sigma-70 family RNA polymerase sigma factor [Desulfitobacterium hafniense]|uniref:RNA polymerase subunit sigma-70 n=2 Tax=Desulfitobacterium hafniense TaxID=49338 RepID=A0A0W1JQ31_DESHA|nr:sigma-70 family RNA polymerase sigma factor [Desulfitobacterium hafniense]EHL05375.1 Sigma-70 region 2 [Desulfitobacterium hafniense DP7]KTE93327.1 RNA polymerase subunit sigma-70 [Desulfitobacterium hafniense]